MEEQQNDNLYNRDTNPANEPYDYRLDGDGDEDLVTGYSYSEELYEEELPTAIPSSPEFRELDENEEQEEVNPYTQQ